ncbi:unnamed protein product (macronuclear) [Paramecium tetraurelia]|uniref:Anaphase-promoting complex subunit 4 WD40 domain-containing protein n=1 Tax=Paramecium tetraurelia TaxID=5888 RepID=A0BYS3_PARTE|nr:uncharacterized protein GSPATT00033543001 [Paramecium tetraurelia]CAK63690.1 unnamed protein product [Paramecium tetraurelia]|eukprot:XP_001431088.1 hypothetical protein (macronuclear) [Paramecium tetraurelia strain d4-2]
MTFSRFINVLAFGCETRIRLYEAEENNNPIDLVQVSSTVITLAFQGNEKKNLISCDKKGCIQFWDIESKQNFKVIELYNTMSLLLSPNGKFIAYKDHQDYIKLLDLKYPKVVYSFKVAKKRKIFWLLNMGYFWIVEQTNWEYKLFRNITLRSSLCNWLEIKNINLRQERRNRDSQTDRAY